MEGIVNQNMTRIQDVLEKIWQSIFSDTKESTIPSFYSRAIMISHIGTRSDILRQEYIDINYFSNWSILYISDLRRVIMKFDLDEM